MLETPYERALAVLLLRFHEVLIAATVEYKPNLITGYLWNLASAYSGFFVNCPVLKAETPELRQSRLLLCDLTARVMQRRSPTQLTLADVAKEAGVVPATLIQRFGTKRGLLLAMCRTAPTSVPQQFAVARAKYKSPLKTLVELYAECTAFASTPEAMANSLAYLQIDLTDPDFHANTERRAVQRVELQRHRSLHHADDYREPHRQYFRRRESRLQHFRRHSHRARRLHHGARHTQLCARRDFQEFRRAH